MHAQAEIARRTGMERRYERVAYGRKAARVYADKFRARDRRDTFLENTAIPARAS